MQLLLREFTAVSQVVYNYEYPASLARDGSRITGWEPVPPPLSLLFHGKTTAAVMRGNTPATLTYKWTLQYERWEEQRTGTVLLNEEIAADCWLDAVSRTAWCTWEQRPYATVKKIPKTGSRRAYETSATSTKSIRRNIPEGCHVHT